MRPKKECQKCQKMTDSYCNCCIRTLCQEHLVDVDTPWSDSGWGNKHVCEMCLDYILKFSIEAVEIRDGVEEARKKAQKDIQKIGRKFYEGLGEFRRENNLT